MEDAESNLYFLHEKALQAAQDSQDVVDTIQRNCDLKPSADSFDADANLENRLSPRSQAALNYAHLLKLLEDLKRARQQLFNMRQRKLRMGTDAGLVYKMAKTLAGDTIDAHRVVQFAKQEGLQSQTVERIYKAHFAEEENTFDNARAAGRRGWA